MEIGFKEKSSKVVDEEKWVHDTSLDHKGRVPIRASTGVWKASIFIIALEVSERLSFFGIEKNLITYLIQVLHQDLKTAAKNVNYWLGVTELMPLIGGFVADSYLGRFSTVLLSSIIYLTGLCLLIMSQLVPSLKPCLVDPCHKSAKLHKAIFFISMYMISIATGGHKPSLESFGADQFDDEHSEERKKKMSYFNLWSFAICCGLLLGSSVVVYVQDNVSWGVAVIILTSVMAVATAVFFLGRPFYRYTAPNGSPITPMLQVLVAAVAKRNLPYPSDPSQLYEMPESQQSNKRPLRHTSKLRFLDKSAIVPVPEDNETQSTEKRNPWRLTTVTEVESLKLVFNMVPIWLATLMFGVCLAQPSTFFIKQGSTMNRKLADNFEIPPASISTLNAAAMIMTILFYDRILVPILRRVTHNERGISILQRVGVGMALSVLAMAVAAVVERRRLNVVEKDPLRGAQTMSVFWLVPQYMIMGAADALTLVGLQEYFYDQVPDAMRSLGIAFYLSVIGISNFLSGLLITMVDHVTEKDGGSGWFAKDLNESRLDCFYWLLAVMSGINLFVYVLLARSYSYKNV